MKRQRRTQRLHQPQYSAYKGYEFPAINNFTDLWGMLGVKMPDPCQIEVITDASKTAITEVCMECTQGQCIVHETSEQQIIVDESHQSVN